MAKYVFPAIFTPEENGAYSVRFPDVPGCYTSGESLPEAIEMAEDALCLLLYDMEESGEALPIPSDISTVSKDSQEFVTLIACDTLEYRKLYDNKAVKKTLSIPAWLNTMAEKQGVNFSQVLQTGLKQAIHIDENSPL
ncbi:MAG: type II toxin-antitoxin system HicB family antitoxin [Acutalibacter sp.]|nr:type II toxin-antitoxin system HicB family antitoxin [Acutalibacter sp.]